MRHRLRSRSAIPAAVVLLVLVAGCGNPGGADGDLTGAWAALSAPAGFVPAAGSCHLGNYSPVGSRSTYDEVDCEQSHRTETVYVGRYTGPAGDSDVPPMDGSPAARDAYHSCDVQTTTYAGGQWHSARLWIGVTNPTAAAWTGGARWFRCDVLEISSIEDDGGVVQRDETLKDALRQPASPLLLTCYGIEVDSRGEVDTMPAASCNGRHSAEYAGLWYAGGTSSYPTSDTQWAAFHAGCRRLIAAYAGVPDDADLPYRTGVISLPGGADVWAQGDRAVRCYLWVDGAALTSSVKGKGVAGLPIQYK